MPYSPPPIPPQSPPPPQPATMPRRFHSPSDWDPTPPQPPCQHPSPKSNSRTAASYQNENTALAKHTKYNPLKSPASPSPSNNIRSACAPPNTSCQPSASIKPPRTNTAPTIGFGLTRPRPRSANAKHRRIQNSCSKTGGFPSRITNSYTHQRPNIRTASPTYNFTQSKILPPSAGFTTPCPVRTTTIFFDGITTIYCPFNPLKN
jgi:hypothetical protein